MTTLVATKNGMWSDSALSGDCRLAAQKIFRIGGYLVGCAGEPLGSAWFFESIARVIRARKWPCVLPTPNDAIEFQGLVLTPKRAIYFVDEKFGWYLLSSDYATIGTGAQAAHAAMLLHSTPREAIELAAQVDPSSALPVQEFMLR